MQRNIQGKCRIKKLDMEKLRNYVQTIIKLQERDLQVGIQNQMAQEQHMLRIIVRAQ